MIGFVDESLRALVDMLVAADRDLPPVLVKAWVDTAFNGSLVIPRSLIDSPGLKQASTTQAILADGRAADLETFSCDIHWFDSIYRTQIVANDGAFPLPGTSLLAGRSVPIDYVCQIVEIE